MKRFLILFFAVFFPWILMLKNDNPGGAFVALVLQATLIGWPLATIWSWRIEYPEKAGKKAKKQVKE